MKQHFAQRICAVVAAFILLSTGARCWESDVHYGLTRWLAIQAGFSEGASEKIAAADQGVDDSWITAPILSSILSVCIGAEDANGGTVIHDNHFPSERNPPNAPGDREVIPGHLWQSRQTRQPPTDKSDAAFLDDLGRYLHTFQDSWAHQGEPDIPPMCSPRVAWGHARLRGGWACHLADYTYRWTDSEEMAQATYELLAKESGGNAVGWIEIRDDVRSFLGLTTKYEKDHWFTRHGMSDPQFLRETTLPDCFGDDCHPYAYKIDFAKWEAIVRENPHTINDNVPKAVVSWIESFLNGVARAGSKSTYMEFVDRTLAASAMMNALNVEEPCPELFEKLTERSLGNGFIDGYGAARPTLFCEVTLSAYQFSKRQSEIGANQSEANRRRKFSCEEAKNILLLKARGADQPLLPKPPIPVPFVFEVVPGKNAGTYLAAARFIHLPNQVLLVTADERPRIIDFEWLPLR